MRRIVSGDQVKVISGCDVGKLGVIQKVFSSSRDREDFRVVVSDVNVRKFIKKTQAGKKFETKACPIAISNVALVARDGLASKVAFRVQDRVKKRFFKRNAEFV